MRFYLGHRLPGGFYGGIGIGGRRRPRRAPVRVRSVSVRSTPARLGARGGAGLLKGLFWLLVIAAVLITLAVEFWPVTVTITAAGAVVAALVRQRRGHHAARTAAGLAPAARGEPLPSYLPPATEPAAEVEPGG